MGTKGRTNRRDARRNDDRDEAGLIRTVLYLHQDERRALKMAAAESDVPASEIMRQALRRHLGIED